MFENNLKKFLFADLISQFGAGMSMAAMSWYILEQSGSNELLAQASNINIISGLIVTILIGSIIDNFSKKNTIIYSLIVRAILVIIPICLLRIYGFEKYFIFILALSNGIGWNIYFPASKGLLQEITSKKDLIKMNSGAEITMQIGLFSSGAVAGTLYKFIGFYTILIISTITFLLAAFIMHLIESKEEKINKSQNLRKLFSEGLIFLSKNKFIFFLGLTMYIPFIAASIFNIILPGFVIDVLEKDSAVYGLIDMFYGLGACIAGVTVILFSKKISQNKIIYIGFIACIASGILMFFNKSTIYALVITLVFGICGPAIRTIIYSIIMEEVPKPYIGRVMSVWNIISQILQIIMIYVIGSNMDKLGIQYGFIIYSIVILFGLIIFYCSNYYKKDK